MTNYSFMSLEELQRVGPDDDSALLELGKRVVDFNFCTENGIRSRYCDSGEELYELKQDLENEMPPDCPHCGKLVDADPEDYPPPVSGSR